jgi:hypothetical protein
MEEVNVVCAIYWTVLWLKLNSFGVCVWIKAVMVSWTLYQRLARYWRTSWRLVALVKSIYVIVGRKETGEKGRRPLSPLFSFIRSRYHGRVRGMFIILFPEELCKSKMHSTVHVRININLLTGSSGCVQISSVSGVLILGKRVRIYRVLQKKYVQNGKRHEGLYVSEWISFNLCT